MIDAATTHTFERFCERSLPKPEWTHEAHLVVCWATLATRGPADAITFLRTAITAYNEATGVENTPTSGYHETLTCYFVGAVASLEAARVDVVLTADRCRTSAPLDHWSRGTLFSSTARATWVEPDLAPLEWSTEDLLR